MQACPQIFTRNFTYDVPLVRHRTSFSGEVCISFYLRAICRVRLLSNTEYILTHDYSSLVSQKILKHPLAFLRSKKPLAEKFEISTGSTDYRNFAFIRGI